LSLLSHALRNPQALLNEKHATRHTTHSPDFDLRETAEAYYLEGEFAGVKNRDAIKLRWLDGHTLRVEGEIEKTNLEQEWSSAVGHGVKKSGSRSGTELGHIEEGLFSQGKGNGDYGGEKTVGFRSWLHERRTGMFIRTFNFPCSVDQDGIQARLSQGLLRILVPKANRLKLTEKEVKIDDVDLGDGHRT